jgi:hypothetical protein
VIGTNRASLVTNDNLAYAQSINPDAVVYNRDTVSFGKAKALVNHANCDPVAGCQTVMSWYNFNMFTAALPGHLGDSGRNILRGPGQINWDFSLKKDAHLAFLGEGGLLEFRAEAFNILNHVSFGTPNGAAITQNAAQAPTISTSAGLDTFTASTSREIQFSLRIQF